MKLLNMGYNKRCPYCIILKDFDLRIKLCKLQQGNPVACPEFKEDCPVYSKEYNLDTSAGHPVKDDDIVRYSLETRRVKDKEP